MWHNMSHKNTEQVSAHRVLTGRMPVKWRFIARWHILCFKYEHIRLIKMNLNYPYQGGPDMMQLDELRKDNELLNAIDWNMTPEEAVRLYLEWGNNWTRGNYVIRSKNDVSYYFTVYAWEDPPVIYLIRRNSEEAVELAKIPLPEDLKKGFLEETGHNKGVYSLDGKIKTWLKSQLVH